MKNLFIAVLILLFTNSYLSQSKPFTEELLLELNRIVSIKISPDGKKALYEMQTMSISENKGNLDLYLVDLASKKIAPLTATSISEGNSCFDKTGLIWFMRSDGSLNQIYTIDQTGMNETKRSTFTEDIAGFTLSPDLSKVAVIHSIDLAQNVNEKHKDMPKANVRLIDDLMYRHWNYYNSDIREHIFTYDIRNLNVASIGSDINKDEATFGVLPPFGGSESFCFNADGTKIFYSTKKLLGYAFAKSTNTDIFEYDCTTKKTRNLSIANKGYDNGPQLSPDGKYLSWLSMKTDGVESDKNDLTIMNLTDNTIQNITSTIDITVDDIRWNAKSNAVFLILPTKGTKQIHELIVANKKMRQVTQGMFDINGFEIQNDVMIAMRGSMQEPNDVYTIELKKGKMIQITEVNKEKLIGTVKPNIEERWVEASDGKKILTWVIYPPNFDPNKKYPTLLYCQGGPQSMVSQFFSYRWNLRLMASKGYIIVAPNRRGLPGFGQEWNDAISKDWGGQSIKDYLSAIDDVSNEPYVDTDRLGAIGASYGGYSTYFLAGCHQKRFKTFVSHCGLFNLESWYLTTEEIFFANNDIGGPFWKPENKALFEKNSPHKYLQNWDTPMLVIHGENDFRVPIGEGLQAFQACKMMGLKSRLLTFPSEGHWITKPQNGIVWYREFFEWLASDLKPN